MATSFRPLPAFLSRGLTMLRALRWSPGSSGRPAGSEEVGDRTLRSIQFAGRGRGMVSHSVGFQHKFFILFACKKVPKLSLL